MSAAAESWLPRPYSASEVEALLGPMLAPALGVVRAIQDDDERYDEESYPDVMWPGMCSLCLCAGVAWGGADAETDARWKRAADYDFLERVATYVGSLPFASACLQRLFVAGGHGSFLTPGAVQWEVLRAVARAFVCPAIEDWADHRVTCSRM